MSTTASIEKLPPPSQRLTSQPKNETMLEATLKNRSSEGIEMQTLSLQMTQPQVIRKSHRQLCGHLREMVLPQANSSSRSSSSISLNSVLKVEEPQQIAQASSAALISMVASCSDDPIFKLFHST